MYRFSLALAVLMLAGSSLGHFMLDVPTGRGFADATNTQAPCGGYNVSSAPVDFFLEGGKITLSILDGHGAVLFYYTQPDWSAYRLLPNQAITVSGAGSYDAAIDLAAVGASPNAEGTIQVVFESNNDDDTFNANFYQCVDVLTVAQPGSAASLRPVFVF